jgi:hypothetical protein
VFKGHNAIMLGDGTIANVGFGLDGGVTAKFEEGISRTNDNSDTNNNQINDKGVTKHWAYDKLSSMFGPENARDIIAGWNSFTEMASGAGVVAGAFGVGGLIYSKTKGMKNKTTDGGVVGVGDDGQRKTFDPNNKQDFEEFKRNNRPSSSVNYQSFSPKEAPDLKDTMATKTKNTNPNDIPINSNIDNPKTSMTSSSNDMANYNTENPKKSLL